MVSPLGTDFSSVQLAICIDKREDKLMIKACPGWFAFDYSQQQKNGRWTHRRWVISSNIHSLSYLPYLHRHHHILPHLVYQLIYLIYHLIQSSYYISHLDLDASSYSVSIKRLDWLMKTKDVRLDSIKTIFKSNLPAKHPNLVIILDDFQFELFNFEISQL